MSAPVENRIFVSNLPPAATQEDVAQHFAQFGATDDVYVPMVFGAGRHKGIAYVTFAQAESKEFALSHQGHQMLGAEVSVQHCLAKGQGKGALPGTQASGDNRVFIQGIGQDVTQEDVQAYFSQFGTWSDIFMPKGSFTAGHKGICFISYGSPDSVSQVMQSGPHLVRGQQVTVDIAVARDAKGPGKGAPTGGPPMMHGGQAPLAVLAPAYGSGYGTSTQPHYQPMQHHYQQPQQHYQPPQQHYQLPQQHYQPPQQHYQPPQQQQHYQLPQQQHYQPPQQQQLHQQQQPQHQQQQFYQPLQAHPQPHSALGVAPPAARPVGPPAGKVMPGRLFLTRMSPGLVKDDLSNYFSQFGVLNDVYIPSGGKLIAFIGYDDQTVAASVAAMQSHEVTPGCSVCVEPAIERQSPGGSAGGGKGCGKARFGPY
mmetsp:Transcript_42599/g.110216  ORF Transcript_42599/g.110216 Transcript_42599/m.110216 type:complete len:425 (-) Transcript_42599:145-1419(-)